MTALTGAALYGHVEVLGFLVEQGANKDAKQKYDMTALCMAA